MLTSASRLPQHRLPAHDFNVLHLAGGDFEITERSVAKPCQHRGWLASYPYYRCVRCHGLFKRDGS